MRLRWLPALLLVVASVVLSTAPSGCKQSTTVETDKGKMTVSSDSTLTITQGETETLKVSVDRKNMDDVVQITIDNLPKGVTVKGSKTEVAKGEKDVEVILEAADDAAKVENHEMTVKASAGGASAEHKVKTTVKSKT